MGSRIVLPNTAITAKGIDITAGNTVTGEFVYLGDGPLRGHLESNAIALIQTVSLAPPHGERPAYLGLQFADDPGDEPQNGVFQTLEDQ